MPVKRYRNALLTFKEEGIEGVDSGPTAAADAVSCNVLSFNPQPNEIANTAYEGSLDEGEPSIGACPFEWSAELNLKGGGSVSVAPEWAPIFKACSFAQTQQLVVPSSGTIAATAASTTTTVVADRTVGSGTQLSNVNDSYLGMPIELSGNPATPRVVGIVGYTVVGNIVTITISDTMQSTLNATTTFKILANMHYVPFSGDVVSGTAHVYRDGLRYKFVGSRGSVNIRWISGNKAVLAFTMRAMFFEWDDTAVPADAVYDSTSAPLWKGGMFTIDKKQAALGEFSWNTNGQLLNPDNPAAEEGVDAAQIMRRNVQGTMNPYQTSKATRALMDAFRNGVKQPLHARMGSVAGNRVMSTIPQAKFRNNTPGDRDGAVIEDVPFQAVGPNKTGMVAIY